MIMWQMIWSFIKLHPEITVVGAVTLVQIAPIKINPWSWVGRTLRRVIIGDIDEKLREISKKVDKIEDTINDRDAILSRTHILRFNDELYNGVKHSKEYFDQQLEDCDRYDQYCDDHPEFKNSRTIMAKQNIKETYDRLLKEHKFL
jgi:hypothetical protein